MRKLLGHVDVDAGLIWVGDPCYIMGDDASSRVSSWGDFVNVLLDQQQPSGESEPIGQGVGLAISTLYGDGSYPVYGELTSDGQIKRVIIDFEGNED